MGKVLESVLAKRIVHLAESLKLLPDSQMGARPRRSTESALDLLTEQVHTIWGQGKDKVASILSLDVASAFPTVLHTRLLHDLKMRRIPQWIINWIGSFLKDRTTTLAINMRSTGAFSMNTGIPQGSPLSPILYLFYNAELLETCNRAGKKAVSMGFVDDINILAYGTSTEANCRTLERMHDICAKWARSYGAKFSFKKYELIHLAKNPKKFNMKATVNIDTFQFKAKTDIRILGLQIDTKLKWGPHINKIKEKMITQKLAMSRLTASTWGASLAKARVIYSAVIRPAITYGSAIWRTPSDMPTHIKSIDQKLGVIQNSCLRIAHPDQGARSGSICRAYNSTHGQTASHG